MVLNKTKKMPRSAPPNHNNRQHSSLKFKRLRAEKKSKIPLPDGKDTHRSQLLDKQKKRKKETKREKKRRLKSQAEFPGIDDVSSDTAESLTVGRDILSFTFDNNNEKPSDASDTESNETTVNGNASENGAKPITSSNDSEKPQESNSQDERPESNEKEEEDFISLELDAPDTDLGRQFHEYESNEVLKAAPWMADDETHKTPNTSVAAQLSHEMLEFLRYISPNQAEKQKRNQCIGRLRRVVHQLWPTASVEVFGSYATGMYLPEADIDVVVFDTETMSHKLRNEMYKLSNRMRTRGVADTVQVIAHARVPIVKYVDAESNLNVDIAFGQTSGVEVVGRVCKWLRENPSLKPLAMIIRQFLKRRALSDVANGGLGGYATICMAYSRLMQWKLHLRPGLDSEKLLNNIGLLLIDFFDFYGNEFDNQNLVVRVNSGFKPYAKRFNGNMITNKTQGIAIEDPNDYGNNISKGTYNYATVKRSFSNAASYLKGLCTKWASLTEHGRENISFLEPLLQFDEDEPVRTKTSLENALSTPTEPKYRVLEKAPMEPKIEAARKDIADSIREHMTARPPQKRGARKRSDSRIQNQEASKQQKNDSPEPAPKPKVDASKPKTDSSKPKIDPWSGKVEASEPDVTGSNEQSETNSSPKSKPKTETVDLTNDDEEDSRTKLTSSERRSFWKSKAGTPDPEPEN